MSRADLPPKIDPVAERRRAHARAVRTDLVILTKHRLANAQELDLFWLGFCWAVPVMMFPAGRYRDWKRFKRGPRKGKYLKGEYWPTWPEANAEAFAADAGVDLDDDQTAEIARGIDAAKRIGAVRFMTRRKMGDRLKVTAEEILNLAIHKFLPCDCTVDEWKALLADRRRQQDREAKKEKRREAGMKPRAMSVEKLKPWEHIGESRRAFYNRPKEERDQWVNDILNEKGLSSCTGMSAPYTRLVVADEVVHTSEIVGDHPASLQEHDGLEAAPAADPPPIIPTDLDFDIDAPFVVRRDVRFDMNRWELVPCR